MKKYSILLLTVLTLILASCGSSRRVTHEIAGGGDVDIQQRFDAMTSYYSDWDKISVPVKAQVKSPISISLSGKLYMVKDSLIHVSLKMLGMEVALLHVTTDSVYCIDKFHKLAVVESLNKYNFDGKTVLDYIQTILLGRAFPSPGEETLSPKSRSIIGIEPVKNGMWSFKEYWNRKSGSYIDFKVSETLNQLVAVCFATADGTTPVGCTYSGWTESDLPMVPKNVQVAASLSGRTVDLVLTYTSGSLLTGDKVSVPVLRTPLKGYRIITASELMNQLKSAL